MKTIKDNSDENETPKIRANFVKGNKVFIFGDFDKTISSNVIPDLLELIETAAFAKDPEIEFYINSPGGFANELLALLSAIEMAKKANIKIVTYNLGIAYSCGSMLAVVGDYRYMFRYADNLPHLGQAFLSPQTFEQLERGSKHVADWFSMIHEIYAKHTKIPKKELMKVLKDDDYHMNAEECLKLGFCDEII